VVTSPKVVESGKQSECNDCGQSAGRLLDSRSEDEVTFEFDSYQDAVDRMVELYLSAKEAEAIKICKEIFSIDDVASYIEVFKWIPNYDLKFSLDEYLAAKEDEELEVEAQDRLRELRNGAKPNERERREYREMIIARAEDADKYPAYYINCIVHSNGNQIYVVHTILGYSFSLLTFEFYGLFSTLEECKRYFSTRGKILG
jgi:hypothetical protein